MFAQVDAEDHRMTLIDEITDTRSSTDAIQDNQVFVTLQNGIKWRKQIETGKKFTSWCREFCIDSKYTATRSPW